MGLNPEWELKPRRIYRVSLKLETHPTRRPEPLPRVARSRNWRRHHTVGFEKSLSTGSARPKIPVRGTDSCPNLCLNSSLQELQKRSDLENLEARGTIRLALKSSGLTAREVTQEQMVVVIDQVMPRELRVRGVENPEGVCGELSQAVKGFEAENGESAGASPEDVFRRLSRS